MVTIRHLLIGLGLSLLVLLAPTARADSVIVNGTEIFLVPQTEVYLNGDLIDPAHAPWLRGSVVYATVIPPTRRGLVPLEAAALRFDFGIIGPVTSTAPLRILGQEITSNASTVVLNTPGLSALALGDVVSVSGHIDTNGSMLATLVVRETDPATGWRLSGYVTQVGPPAGEIRVGAQRVNYGLVNTNNCNPAPALGDFIDLRAQAVPGFTASSVLTTLTRFDCSTAVPLGTFGAVGALEGLVTAVPAAGVFRLDAIDVLYNASTVFAFGNADELAEGVRVDVEGSFAIPTEFNATAVSFVRPVLRFQGPVNPADVVPGQSITVLGRTVRRSAQLRDEDLIQTNGLAAPRQVEVRGYVDTAGRLYSTRIRDRGTANANSVRVRGPVSTIQSPNLTVYGLRLDTSGGSFVGYSGNALSQSQFFAQLQAGVTVDAQGGVYNAGNGSVSGGVYTLIAPDVPPPPGPDPQFRLGTSSEAWLGETIFRNGWEAGAQ